MADIHFAFLWTDILIYILFFSISVFVYHTLQHEHLRAPWKIVFERRMGMAAFIVLMSYVSVGLVDSVHYQKGDNPEIISLLDDLVGGLRTREEKTYSAPFATHLFSKETIIHADGSKSREYPRLDFGGAHLQDPINDKSADI